MNLNQIIANLSIVSTALHSIEVDARMSDITEDTPMEFGLDIKYSDPVIEGQTKYGRLLLKINVIVKSAKKTEKPDTFQMVMEGVFAADSSMEDSKFLPLLNINGGAALYSIARAKLEAISGITYSSGKILLPMINMVEYYRERAQDAQAEQSK